MRDLKIRCRGSRGWMLLGQSQNEEAVLVCSRNKSVLRARGIPELHGSGEMFVDTKELHSYGVGAASGRVYGIKEIACLFTRLGQVLRYTGDKHSLTPSNHLHLPFMYNPSPSKSNKEPASTKPNTWPPFLSGAPLNGRGRGPPRRGFAS
jgi:hypothetical protein